MDMAQAFVFDAGWIFFAAWGMILAAVSVIAFGRDLFKVNQPRTKPINHQGHEGSRR
jgi:hypothetical protein